MNTLATAVRRIGRTIAALGRFAKGHTPKWALPVLAVLLVTPGPDELLLLAVVLVPVLRSADARHELAASVRQAWGQS